MNEIIALQILTRISQELSAYILHGSIGPHTPHSPKQLQEPNFRDMHVRRDPVQL